ncbi:hypothetical protein Ddye_030344 [Dipteronia dyeriana]|uniref:Uncharacterized protein n=1 Tax=Dipteronia dyeriana TaxID=168575 RepID=A0AAD9WMF6_9ROSI|nr:hypothetical protein Ddye_030344 [Dipteronia dyeriana]
MMVEWLMEYEAIVQELKKNVEAKLEEGVIVSVNDQVYHPELFSLLLSSSSSNGHDCDQGGLCGLMIKFIIIMWLNRGLGVESDGATGGLTLWNEEFFIAKACIKNSRCTVIAGELMKLAKEIAFCNVYGPNFENERVVLWEFIIGAQVSLPMPWCNGGDFNTVLNEAERIGGICNKVSMRNFNSFMLQAKVVDIPMHGCTFSWSNNRDSASWARLGRFLISPWILSWLPKLIQKGLLRSVSDHSPITIDEPKVDWGPSPFRSYDVWLEDSKLSKLVCEEWIKHKAAGSYGFILSTKLKAVKCIVKRSIASKKKETSSAKICEERLEEVENRDIRDGWS